MLSQITHRAFTAFVMLFCLGCASTQGGTKGSRSWLGYLRYGSDDTPEEKEANKAAWQSSWWGTHTSSVAAPSPSQSPEQSGNTPEVGRVPGTALASLAGNEFNPSWTVSLARPGTDQQVFNKGDKVKVKAKPDAPTMTVEHVSSPVYTSAQDVTDSPVFHFRYCCRGENKDGSESVGEFQAEELEPVMVAGRG